MQNEQFSVQFLEQYLKLSDMLINKGIPEERMVPKSLQIGQAGLDSFRHYKKHVLLGASVTGNLFQGNW